MKVSELIKMLVDFVALGDMDVEIEGTEWRLEPTGKIEIAVRNSDAPGKTRTVALIRTDGGAQ